MTSTVRVARRSALAATCCSLAAAAALSIPAWTAEAADAKAATSAADFGGMDGLVAAAK
jgi:putative spermidine/putrescine transport system substrate-binding protein